MVNPIFGLILFMNVYQDTAAGSSVYLNKVCDIVFFCFLFTNSIKWSRIRSVTFMTM